MAHPDMFHQVGLFSAAGGQFAETLGKHLSSTNSKLDLLWVGVGDEDPLSSALARRLHGDLTEREIPHRYMETKGGHDFSVWRWCLLEFAPLLFR